MMLQRVRSLLLRPSLWVAIISLIAYWDKTSLHGNWVYDDSGSVAKNVVVIGNVPFREVFTRDYWGTLMKEPASHKSFRPITTITFRLNYIFNERVLKVDPLDTYSYRLVNLILHVLVSFLVTEAAAYMFPTTGKSKDNDNLNVIAQLVTGFLFALHPVHVEAVSNVTSRGELLMSLFFLMAFLSYASHLDSSSHDTKTITTFTQQLRSILCIYILPCLGMAASLFSKEQGATTLISLVVYDFLHHFESVQQYLLLLLDGQKKAVCFLRRAIILAIQTLLLAGFRYYLNGETTPDFIFDQNPAGFSEDRFVRTFSTCWVYCLYIQDAIFPNYLCPDWSGRSIPLIEDASDERIYAVLLLWAFAGACLYSLLVTTTTGKFNKERKVVLVAFFGFLFAPFLLSSNLVVVTGLMKADRVIYLPLLGFCIMEALAIKMCLAAAATTTTKQKKATTTSNHPFQNGLSTFLYLCVMFQLLLLTAKLHERNHAWSHSLPLWLSAYRINPVSHHTMYNCGYELSIKQRYAESEQIMRPIGNPRVDGPSNTFVYAMVLFNLDRCDEANVLLEDAFAVLDEKRATGGPRNVPHMLDRSESNLLVAKAHCAPDVSQRGRILYQAVQKDQTNSYAIEQAQGLMKQVEQLKKYQGYR